MNQAPDSHGTPRLKLVSERSPPASDEDHELDWSIMMARAQSGDGQAYRRLLTSVTPFLRARALRQLRSPEEAEDAVQDILLTLHRVRQSYDPARPFGPWLSTIAHHRLADRLRKRERRRRTVAALSAITKTPGTEPSVPHDKAVLDRRALEAALAALTPEQANAIRLLKIEELTLEDAAAVTGRSVGALKGSTHRALQALRRILFREGPR